MRPCARAGLGPAAGSLCCPAVQRSAAGGGSQPLTYARCRAATGFERFAQGQLITLFSATNYCGTANNAGAILVLGRDLTLYPKLIHPLPPSILEEGEDPHDTMKEDTWMQSINRDRPPTPPRGRQARCVPSPPAACACLRVAPPACASVLGASLLTPLTVLTVQCASPLRRTESRRALAWRETIGAPSSRTASEGAATDVETLSVLGHKPHSEAR